MEAMTGVPIELSLLGWSVVLLIVYMLTQSGIATKDRGLTWNAGPRDEAPTELSKEAGRADRALRNYLETWPAFIALALAVVVAGVAGGLTATGAWIWFVARIVYLPLYVLGVPYVRSIAWAASIVGLVLMLIPLIF
ncbi:MAPEG family protein [Pararhizobium mangrovi]|uniref:MAPEG family protein n=1 Tax=Pararhizobium mangrovi TaxID=2590452 RepID=A0A506U3Q8_9HYPH|nr:MAPEG family protein [Pararhizobium mangrovi]TPW27966.1 hypothetical protein FJU11_10510 [Pararhizobium mangrovi]